jgi:hypothetical protein
MLLHIISDIQLCDYCLENEDVFLFFIFVWCNHIYKTMQIYYFELSPYAISIAYAIIVKSPQDEPSCICITFANLALL